MRLCVAAICCNPAEVTQLVRKHLLHPTRTGLILIPVSAWLVLGLLIRATPSKILLIFFITRRTLIDLRARGDLRVSVCVSDGSLVTECKVLSNTDYS